MYEVTLCSEAERFKCFELAYREYLASGYCKEQEDKTYFTRYHVGPGGKTFQFLNGTELLGTITLVLDSNLGLPMDETYPEQMIELRSKKSKIAEVSLLALDSRNSNRIRSLFSLFKHVYKYAMDEGVSDLVIGVHPKHQAFYRTLDFLPIGTILARGGPCNNPLIGLHHIISLTS